MNLLSRTGRGAPRQFSRRNGCRALIVALASAVLVPGCTVRGVTIGPDGRPVAAGGVVAEDGQAALVGRDVLLAGGTSADAATAMFMALAVTAPEAAGLGASGVCVAYDVKSNAPSVIDFMPAAALAPNATPVPLGVRGMALLQARFGAIRWEQLVLPAERLARFGITTPKSLAAAMASTTQRARLDPQALATFTPEAVPGQDAPRIVQPQLAATLERIRRMGAGELYQGQTARRLVEDSAALGMAIDSEALRLARPTEREPLLLEIDNRVVALPPPPSGGAIAADMIAVFDRLRLDDAPDERRPHILAEAARRALAAELRRRAGEASQIGSEEAAARLIADYQPERAASPSPLTVPQVGGGATGFAAIDPQGGAVACAVTLGAPFGSGRMAAQTGILLPAGDANAALGLVPMVLANTKNKRAFLALSADGDAAAPQAAAEAFGRIVLEQRPLDAALAAPRVVATDRAWRAEPSAGGFEADLAARGHSLETGPIDARVHAVWCPEGVPLGSLACRAAADPRSFGLGIDS